ncbi:MAG TPA: hypothetical protein PLU49_13070, partial [Saprospiraceae bacterium]|nr:hypothetical protein [Saprospiraceae bacterium]
MNCFNLKYILFILSFYHYAYQYNEVEKGIVSGNYQNAYDAGIIAIKTYPKATWKIVHNTLLLADSLHKNTDIGLLSYEIGRRGACLDYLKSFSFYNDDHSLIDSAWQSGNESFLKNFKQDYLDSLFNMIERDQSIRNLGVSRDSIGVIDSFNMISFEGLVRKYGFPNEFVIGLRCKKIDRGHVINEGYFQTMFRHFALRNYQTFKEILDNEFLKGSLDLYDYNEYLTTFYPNPINYVKNPFVKIESKYYQENFFVSVDSVNAVRKIYGLPSREDQLNSFIYKIKKPDS